MHRILAMPSAPRLRRALFSAVAVLTLWSLGAETVAEAKKGKRKKTEVGVINGRVLDMEEKIVSGAAVKVTSADGAFEESATSDRKGVFSVSIPDASGEYTVYLEKEGFAPFSAAIPLSVGDEQNIDFRLLSAEMGQRQQAVDAYNEGVQVFNQGDRAKAKELFQTAAELDPSIFQAHFGLTDIYLAEEDYAAAAESAERYIAMQPDDAKGKRLAYQAYLGLGDEDKLRVLRTALKGTEFAENLAVQTFNMGAIASQKGDLEVAVAQFQAALELDPSLKSAHSGLASVFYNMERWDDALASIDKVLEADPGNVQGRRIRYLIYDVQGDAAQLGPALDAYAEVDPAGAADVLFQRAEMDFKSNEVETAKANLEKVIELAPDMARAYYTLGLVYFSIDTAKAKHYLQKFIDMAPNDPEVETARQMMTQ